MCVSCHQKDQKGAGRGDEGQLHAGKLSIANSLETLPELACLPSYALHFGGRIVIASSIMI